MPIFEGTIILYTFLKWPVPGICSDWSGCLCSPVNTAKMNWCHKGLSSRQATRLKRMPQWQLEEGKENPSSLLMITKCTMLSLSIREDAGE